MTNTALSLNMSQSKISRSLAKLRMIFSDDLLVRTATGYELTSKAQMLQQEVDTILYNLENLFRTDTFTPENSHAELSFVSLPTSANIVLPEIVAKIGQLAPHMLVNIDTSSKNHFESLLNSDAHFVISTSEPNVSEQDIYRMKLLEWGHCLLMSKDHPLANESLTPEMLIEYPFGEIAINGSNRASLEAGFKSLDIERESSRLRRSVQVTDFSSAVAISECTDVMFHVPDLLVQETCKHRNVILKEVPETLRFPTENVYLYWHKLYHMDPMCIWVRSLFKDRFAAI